MNLNHMRNYKIKDKGSHKAKPMRVSKRIRIMRR